MNIVNNSFKTRSKNKISYLNKIILAYLELKKYNGLLGKTYILSKSYI